MKTVRNTKAIPLCLASLLVAALFLPPSVTMVREAIEDREGYDALRAAFVLMEGFWLFVAISRLWLVWKFGRTLSDLKKNLSRL